MFTSTYYKARFLNLSTTEILEGIIPYYWGLFCAILCRMFSSIPGLISLDASSTFLVMTAKKCLQISLGGKTIPSREQLIYVISV